MADKDLLETIEEIKAKIVAEADTLEKQVELALLIVTGPLRQAISPIGQLVSAVVIKEAQALLVAKAAGESVSAEAEANVQNSVLTALTLQHLDVAKALYDAGVSSADLKEIAEAAAGVK